MSQSGFFLSPQGHTNALAELDAELDAFAAPWAGKPDDAPACRWPARRHWLAEQLPARAAHWPEPDCPALDTWMQALD
ncbi:MAG: hypothetical protein VW625_03455, partial [Perlucidibaca sp.]